MSSRWVDTFIAAAGIAGAVFVAFFAGSALTYKEWFPYSLLHNGEVVARHIWHTQIRRPYYIEDAHPGTPAQSEARSLDPAKTAPGVTFVVAYTEDNLFKAWLVDQQGETLHQWEARFSEIFPEPDHLVASVKDSLIAWHGSHLYPDGSILFNFQDNNFPYGSGMVKLDKDSNLVWKLAENTHHDITVADDGTIWASGQAIIEELWEIVPNFEPWYYDDLIVKVSPEGELDSEISVLNALADHAGVLTTTFVWSDRVTSSDPLHLNNVEPLPAELADQYPMLAAGDIMISLRNINSIAFVDPNTGKVKRTIVGQFVRQHDPDFMPNGHLLIYDNRGAPIECGGTRVIELDPGSMEIVWSYDGCDRPMPFDSNTRGVVQLLENGNVLTVDALHGRIMEVTREAEPELVWEYFNVIGDNDGTPLVGMILHAERFAPDQLTFLE
ncbi:MAG: arylsulfotransferase family protein [Pseudomonadota bacterium]